MIWGHPPPPPLASVGKLYIQGVERQRRGAFRTGKGVGGPKSYDSTKTLVLYILHSLYGGKGSEIIRVARKEI